MSFDSRCYDLAYIFCQSEPRLDNEIKRNELAQLIQTTIEDWIEYGEHKAPTICKTCGVSLTEADTLACEPQECPLHQR